MNHDDEAAAGRAYLATLTQTWRTATGADVSEAEAIEAEAVWQSADRMATLLSEIALRVRLLDALHNAAAGGERERIAPMVPIVIFELERLASAFLAEVAS